MGKRPKLTFLQRRHTDGQKVHKNVLKITIYQQNANQYYSEISLRKGQTPSPQKSTNNKCWRGCAEKEIFLYCWQEFKLVTVTVENSMEVSEETKNRATI